MTAAKKTAPFGAWKSPIDANAIASSSLRLGQIAWDGDDLYYLEGRPSEGGRSALVVRHKDGSMEDALPADTNVRTLVHEYGGGAFTVEGGEIFYVQCKDQRLYVKKPGQEPIAITVDDNRLRYADMVVDRKRNRLICVLEDHGKEGKEAENMLCAIDLSGVGSKDFKPVEPEVLTLGFDFYSYTRLSPDSEMLSYLAWNHPNLPWDGTELHLIKFDSSGKVQKDVLIAGSMDESIFEPIWSPDGKLFFVDESSGWWNLQVLSQPTDAVSGTVAYSPVIKMEAEFGQPLWVFGMSTYAFLNDGRVICAYNQRGAWKLGIISKKDDKDYSLETIDTSPYSEFNYVYSNGKKAAMHVGSSTAQSGVAEFDPATSKFTIVKLSSPIVLEEGFLAVPQVIEFPTDGGLTAFAFFYPPTNKDFQGPEGQLPPLLVKSHGGPTGATSTSLNLGIQYYTSRGFAVVDVNYGGSTGYGKEYRHRLNYNWGVVDMNDCANAAKYLAEKGFVDGEQLAITGGSAGGYTTLCALTYLDCFKAGASHFGIGDVEALCRDTHKFESRYGDHLIGDYPAQKQVYYDRSPINFTEKLNCPVIFFQGLEDAVVPPSQAEEMVNALKKKGLPVAYLAYEGEQHGFRKAENIKRTIEAEFYFYSQIFGFTPADPIEPVHIENLKVGASH